MSIFCDATPTHEWTEGARQDESTARAAWDIDLPCTLGELQAAVAAYAAHLDERAAYAAHLDEHAD